MTLGPRRIYDYSAGIASKNADTDWLGSDLAPTIGGSFFRIAVALATARAIKAVDDTGTVLGFKEGESLVADQVYVFDLPAIQGRTYNLQNVGGASAINYLVIEERTEE